MIGLVLALAAAVVLAACTGPQSNVFYASHGYACCAELAGNATWHPAQQLALHWTPEPQRMTTDDVPHQIVLKLSLTGPFDTVDALKRAISQRAAGARTINAEPLTVNDRTYDTPVSMLRLPADLAPGYYNLDAESSSAGGSSGGGAVVIISP